MLGTRFAKKPLELKIPITIAGMSFGALSAPAKEALGRGATEVGTSTTTGDGGMTPEEREHSKTLVYQLLPSRYGMNPDDLRKADAIEVVVGQGAKPGGGGMLLGHKISDRVAAMRDLPKGIDQRSACRHPDWTGPDDLEIKIGELREITDWQKPVFVKVGATRTYYDVQLAVKAGADVIVVDGMQGGTAATQDVFIEHVGIPTLAAIPLAVAGARRSSDMHREVQLIVSGGIRSGADVAKALALGADAVSIGTAALIAMGDNSARATRPSTARSAAPAGFYDDWQAGRDPAGISTQDDELAARFDPGARRPPDRELPPRAHARDPDARPRLRQVARPQPRARGPRRAHGRGRRDGAGAARRDGLGARPLVLGREQDRPALDARHVEHPVPGPRSSASGRAGPPRDGASTTWNASRPPSTGPPRRMRPSATSPFMKCACSVHCSCSRMPFDQSQGPPRSTRTRKSSCPSCTAVTRLHGRCHGGTRAARPRRARTRDSASTLRAHGNGAELPDAERRPVRAVDRPGAEECVALAVLRPHRLPQLVLVSPGADQQEVELLAAAVEDHEAELAQGAELASATASRRLRRATARIASGTGASSGATSYHLSTVSPRARLGSGRANFSMWR